MTDESDTEVQKPITIRQQNRAERGVMITLSRAPADDAERAPWLEKDRYRLGDRNHGKVPKSVEFLLDDQVLVSFKDELKNARFFTDCE